MPPVSLPIVERESLDNSILSSVGRCPRLGYYNYVLNRAARADNYPINFGVLYHNFRDSLEKAYHTLVIEGGEKLEDVKETIWNQSWILATRGWTDPPIEHKKGYLDLGRALKTCKEAFESWVEEKSLNYYNIVSTELAFDLPLPSGRRFCGKTDQVLEWNGRLWVRDFKTVGRKDDWKAKFNPDHQFSGYVWAAQELSGRRIEGVIVDIVYNIKTKGPEFHPTICSRTSDDLEQWLEWVEFEYDNWERCKAEDKWPMRTTACGDYGGCFFRQCCNRGNWPSIEQWLEERTVFSYWDPLNPEREEAGLPE